ncbi:cytochrome [Streptomyces nanshensis]|nr:cytochrome [Streptomyces nanshensis]
MDTDRSRCPYRLDATATDIHTENAHLRAAGPATLVELPGGVQAWSVTDPGLIKWITTHPKVSKDARQHWPAYQNGDIPENWPLRIWVDVQNALTAYGKEHTRLRRLIARGFTARRIRALTPAIEDITHGLLDQLTPDEDGVVDLREQFAWTLPLLVINILLGVPESAHGAFRNAIGSLFATDVSEEESAAAAVEIYRLLQELVAFKREEPGEDITSVLIAAHDDETGARLSPQELLDSLLLLIGAGHETTVNLIDHGTFNLLAHPEQLQVLRNGEIPWEDAVEEALRHEAPIANLPLRYAVEEIHHELTGTTFRAGDAILVNYAAAGRDPGLHGESPEAFDITRETRGEHLAFGHGTHYCLGATLARLEAAIALPALFERYPHLALAEPAEQIPPLASFISNGHRHLPVRLHASTRTEAA